MEKSDKVKCVYLSHPLSEDTPSYGNRDSVNILPKSRIEDGETANTSTWTFTNNHIGTHVDVPKHFYTNGKTLTDIESDEWLFNSISLIDIPCNEATLIGINDLRNFKIKKATDFLIIRTGYEKKRMSKEYWSSYPGIAAEACEYLRKEFSNLRAVGFDFISLTSPKFKEEGKEAHRVLLEERNGKFVLIIEDMKLLHLEKIPKNILVVPLIVKNGNGGPATVICFDI